MSDPQEGEDEAKMVPLAALEDERQKRQALENDVNYLKGQQQQFEQRLSTPPQLRRLYEGHPEHQCSGNAGTHSA